MDIQLLPLLVAQLLILICKGNAIIREFQERKL